MSTASNPLDDRVRRNARLLADVYRAQHNDTPPPANVARLWSLEASLDLVSIFQMSGFLDVKPETMLMPTPDLLEKIGKDLAREERQKYVEADNAWQTRLNAIPDYHHTPEDMARYVSEHYDLGWNAEKLGAEA